MFFGLVEGIDLELGIFPLSMLEHWIGPYGWPVERDRLFTPTPILDLTEDLVRRHGWPAYYLQNRNLR